MLFSVDQINALAIVLAFVINMAVGSLWYSPLLVGGPWMKLKGLKTEDLKNAGSAMALSSFGGAIAMIVLAYVVSWSGASTILEGFLVGLVLTLLAHTVTFNHICFDKAEGFGDRLHLWMIDFGNTFVTYILVGILYALWV
jgi:hypothetical protein